MPHTCNCGKKFKRLGAFRRHRGICEILREKSDIQKKELEEESDIPPRDEVWVIVKTLVCEIEKLKKENKKMKKNMAIQNKKIKIIEWLNENIKPTTNYKSWFDSFEVEEEIYLEYIFKMGFCNAMVEILENIFDNTIFKAFNQKPNKLYVYENEWILLDLNSFKKIIVKIQHKLIEYFNRKWRNENQNVNSNNDEYMIKSKEICGGNKDFPKQIKSIYNKFYRNIKVDINDFIKIF